MIKNKTYITAITSSLLLLGPNAYAQTVIDNFSATVAGENIINIHTLPAPATATEISNTATGLSGVIEGQRDLTVTRTAAVGIGNRQVLTTISDATDPFFEYASTTGAAGTISLTYGLGTPDVNAGIDLSSETAFKINFSSFDGAGGPLGVAIELTSGGNLFSVSQNFATAVEGGILTYSFSEFSNIDFTDIDQINVEIIAGNGADYDLNSITAVPEPSATLLLGFAFSIGMIRRRR